MKTAQWILTVAIIGVASIAMIGCGSGKAGEGKAKPKKPPRVQAVAAEQTRLVEFLETTGNVVAVNTVMLEATIEGPISFCPWREGDRIDQAGQKMVEIDRPLYRQELVAAEAAEAVARAQLADLKVGARPEEIAQARESIRHFDDCTRFAKADLDRIQSLVATGSLPGEEVEKARVSHVKCHSQLGAAKELLAMLEAGPTQTEIAVLETAAEVAAAKCGLAQAKLDECVIRAPFAGVITEVFVRPGDLATPRTPLLKMMDPSSLVVRAGLPESSSAHIRKGIEVSVQLDAYPDRVFNGKIERVFPRIEFDSRTRMIEVEVTDPVELIPRLFARISVQGRVADDAVVVPGSAIVTTPRGDKSVYVVNEGKASMRKVTIGLEEEQRVQITHGVQAGEMVIIAGNLNLKDGAQVNLDKLAANVENKQAQGSEEDRQTKLQQIVFQDKFPIRLREYNKSELRFSTLDELCQYFCYRIESHPFACHIATFDHYSHTKALKDGIVDSSIIGAKNVVFCFGKKLDSPKVLSVRPRSIGICETESQFVISFLEAPSPTATEMMERWVCEITKAAPSVENKQARGGKEQ